MFLFVAEAEVPLRSKPKKHLELMDRLTIPKGSVKYSPHLFKVSNFVKKPYHILSSIVLTFLH